MTITTDNRPPVLGTPFASPTAAGDPHKGRGGAKNPREKTGCQGMTSKRRKERQIFIGTLNTRTLRDESRVIELESALDNIKWHIIGLSETRISDTQTATLKSGHLLITQAC